MGSDLVKIELDAIMKTEMYQAAYEYCHEMISGVLPLSGDAFLVVKHMLLTPVTNEYIGKSLFLIAFKQAFIDLVGENEL